MDQQGPRLSPDHDQSIKDAKNERAKLNQTATAQLHKSLNQSQTTSLGNFNYAVPGKYAKQK